MGLHISAVAWGVDDGLADLRFGVIGSKGSLPRVLPPLAELDRICIEYIEAYDLVCTEYLELIKNHLPMTVGHIEYTVDVKGTTTG